ncbi:GNAT family N-acetyltransferase [Pseudomonas borbori]|uniref:Acetyltransferase (GNAT) domain-containing protein n=1 Tax=Pseudomonas borbori TaxID=289003 RepID=A0A1I5LN48_9PSED|nr:GNAT family N-acetyltransferase [Pseudomonas borbori]SFO98700.1 Acetyltransferase (GNAT) domain-containing protein [Pseudomonas borbori]
MSTQNHPYTYRPMTAADVPAAHALSVKLKWPHRLEDWAMLQRVAEGFVVEDAGQLIGTAFTCPQGAYATIGLVIVSDDYQGKGIGRRLMEQALQACGSATAVLNATLAGVPLYASQGFIEFGRINQHQGQVQAVTPPALAAGESCRNATADDWPRLLELAKAGSGLDRTRVFDELHDAIERTVILERDGQPCAFAMLRPFGRGRAISPIVAQNPKQARQLIAELLAELPGAFVRLDIQADSGLGEWLSAAGLPQVDSVAQMARGTPPQATGGVQQFALVTQAIG